MSEIKKPFINLSTIKASVAVLLLSAGTLRAFLLEARQNEAMIVIAGVAIVFFCISAIAERIFTKK